ncbi:MAG: hypothetical protein JWQ23_1240 [Herminiimonas sp.]|nr:hypothetical protein [Herminiimonas sp.]
MPRMRGSKFARHMKLHGIDFTSAPTRRKAITIASGELDGDTYRLQSLTSLHDYAAFDAWLRRPGPWLGAFDFPFSLPRELIEHLGWPTRWEPLIRHVAAQTRAELRATFKAFCDARPSGGKFAHRATDRPAGSSSPMKWVNPPVAYMLHAGVPLLLAAGVTVYTLHAGDPHRIALEGYPGMVARSITRASYKSDERARQTPERRAMRELIVNRLKSGDYSLGIRLDAGAHRAALVDDASGDLLDAALCGLLAAWGWQRRDARFGLPEFDPLEGWIVGA